MSARLPRRGPHRRAAARRAGARRCRLAVLLAGLTCAFLASLAVPAAVATTPPAYRLPMILLGAGTPGPCSEVCSGRGYGLSAGTPGPCSEVCSGRGYGLGGPPSQTPGDSAAGNTAKTLPQGRVVTSSAGFHWGDAGIGAGGMLAVIALGLGGTLILTRRNPRIHDQCSTLLGRIWAAQFAGARGAAGPSRGSPDEGGLAPGTDVPPGTDLITF